MYRDRDYSETWLWDDEDIIEMLGLFGVSKDIAIKIMHRREAAYEIMERRKKLEIRKGWVTEYEEEISSLEKNLEDNRVLLKETNTEIKDLSEEIKVFEQKIAEINKSLGKEI